MLKLAAAVAALTLLPSAGLRADTGTPGSEPKPDRAALENFASRRLGFMVHWGPCATIPTEIGWGIGGNRAKYEASYKTFAPKHLDLNRWAEVAERAGAKYAVLVAKHHDGFVLWDTRTTPVNVMATPLHRDVVKEYFAAFGKKKDMLVGTYLSIIDVNKQDDTKVYAARTQPPARLPAGGIPEMVKFTGDQMEELVKYGAKIMWFDGQWLTGWRESGAGRELYARLHRLDPTVITTRLGSPGVEDFVSMEAKLGEYMPTPWETVTSVAYPNYSWNPRLKYKTTEELVGSLARVACGNGNLLLNFIPDPDGEIPAMQIALADALGAWLKHHGASIYDTKGGPWYPADWGGTTFRGATVYVHALPSAPGKLRLPPIANRILTAKTMTGADVPFAVSTDGDVTLDLPAARDPSDTVVVLTLEKPVAGMVAAKESPSIFKDPAYGKIISADAKFAGTDADGVLKTVDGDPAVFGTVAGTTVATTGISDKPALIVDLGKVKTLTGVMIKVPKGGEKLTLSLSTDGKTWREVWKAVWTKPVQEIALTDFSDHTTHEQGEKARYLKIEAHPKKPGDLRIAKFAAYGTE